MKKRRFVKNAALMTGSTLLLRTVGMLFRVWLAGRIGSQGMGLYQLVTSVYLLTATFATGGVATAVTRLIAEELEKGTPRSVERILRRAVMLTLAVGAASCATVLLLADPIAAFGMGDARAAAGLRVSALSLPFMGITYCLRGYFIARRHVTPSLAAQLLEQGVRMAVVFALLDAAVGKGLGAVCAAVLIGDTVAEAAACLFLWIGYRRDRRRAEANPGARPAPPYGIARRLTALTLPLVGGRYLTSALRTAESLLVPACLAAFGGSHEEGVAAYGLFRGMAMPVIFFLSSFLTALATLLVPELSTALACGDRRQIAAPVERVVGLTLAASTLIGGVFFLFGDQVGLVFYSSPEVGELVKWLAPLVPLMYLESVVTGMLCGLDQQKRVFWYNVADSALRLCAIPLLVPRWGMTGFLAVTYASNLLTSLLCLCRLLKVSGVRFRPWAWAGRPLLATAGALTAAAAVGHLCGGMAPLPLLTVESVAAVAICLPLLYVMGGGRDLVRLLGRKKALRA